MKKECKCKIRIVFRTKIDIFTTIEKIYEQFAIYEYEYCLGMIHLYYSKSAFQVIPIRRFYKWFEPLVNDSEFDKADYMEKLELGFDLGEFGFGE